MNVPSPLATALSQPTASDLPDWVRTQRQEGYEWLRRNGLPNLKVEEWKYTSLRSLAEQNFELLERAGEVNEALLSSKLLVGAYHIVIVDGFYCPSFSQPESLPAGVKISALSEVWEARREQITQLTMPNHPFGRLNQALLGSGLMIQIAANAKVERPIQILHWQSPAGEKSHLSCPRIIVEAESNSEVTIIESFGGERGANLLSIASGYWVRDNADLRIYRSQCEHDEAYHMATVLAFLGRDARCELFSLNNGAKLARHDIEASLQGEGGDLILDGVYLTNGERHSDFHTSIHHCVPNATSHQLFKGVLDDRSRAVFNGKIIVHKGAFQTNSYQLNKNLMLSKHAEVDTKPELQIDNDDVKCSHGAAVGQLNEDELFYLRSRGIAAPQARMMLCKAYVEDVLLKLKNQHVAKWLTKQIEAYFEGANLDG